MTFGTSILEVAALRVEVERLTEQLKAATEERNLLEQERDQALLTIDRLRWRLDIAHGEGGK
jgi:hypothetical protein